MRDRRARGAAVVHDGQPERVARRRDGSRTRSRTTRNTSAAWVSVELAERGVVTGGEGHHLVDAGGARARVRAADDGIEVGEHPHPPLGVAGGAGAGAGDLGRGGVLVPGAERAVAGARLVGRGRELVGAGRAPRGDDDHAAAETVVTQLRRVAFRHCGQVTSGPSCEGPWRAALASGYAATRDHRRRPCGQHLRQRRRDPGCRRHHGRARHRGRRRPPVGLHPVEGPHPHRPRAARPRSRPEHGAGGRRTPRHRRAARARRLHRGAPAPQHHPAARVAERARAPRHRRVQGSPRGGGGDRRRHSRSSRPTTC